MSNDDYSFLNQHFLTTAFVKDAQKGYVVARDFNLAISSEVLVKASNCWAAHYKNQKIDAVVGLPDAGSRLTSLLANKLSIPTILPSKRSPHIPGAWQDVISYSNNSFTTNQDEVKSHIGFVEPGMKVLLVDDVVAYGETALHAIKALQTHRIEVIGLAVLFDKQWQGGIKKIESETGVPVYSLISIERIIDSGTLQITNQKGTA